MNREKQLENIRRACIAANPEIERYCSLSQRVDGKTHSEVFDGDDPYTMCAYCGERRSAPSGMLVTPGRGEPRPIRLADVLLAMQEADTPMGIETSIMRSLKRDPNEMYFGYRMGGDKYIGAAWNLCADDITLQSDETVAFIHSILKGV